MKYQRFEDLPVWRAALDLGQAVYALTENPVFKSRYSLCDQIERAAVSVSNNIAEGFERGTNQELLNFLYIARGSAGEVRSMLYLLEGMPPFRNLESEIRDLREVTDSISKQLGAWARSIQDSDLKGRRYVNEKTRRATEQARGREEFLKELEEIRRNAAAEKRNRQSANSKAVLPGEQLENASERSQSARDGSESVIASTSSPSSEVPKSQSPKPEVAIRNP